MTHHPMVCKACVPVVAIQVESMLQRLQQLSWRRIDVSFQGSLLPFAHNHIQVSCLQYTPFKVLTQVYPAAYAIDGLIKLLRPVVGVNWCPLFPSSPNAPQANVRSSLDAFQFPG